MFRRLFLKIKNKVLYTYNSDYIMDINLETVLCGNTETGITQLNDNSALNLYCESNKILSIRNQIMVLYARISRSMGLDVASSSIITLPINGNMFPITGSTDIDYITVAGWPAGSQIVLLFRGSLTINHNSTNPPVGTLPIKLNANVNFSVTSDATLSLISDGNYWFETSRKV